MRKASENAGLCPAPGSAIASGGIMYSRAHSLAHRYAFGHMYRHVYRHVHSHVYRMRGLCRRSAMFLDTLRQRAGHIQNSAMHPGMPRPSPQPTPMCVYTRARRLLAARHATRSRPADTSRRRPPMISASLASHATLLRLLASASRHTHVCTYACAPVCVRIS